LDLRQLAYFVRVIELRSLTKASEALRISQPAIGEQIRNLEFELGAQLMTRHSRGIDPTGAGRLLFAKARAILYQVEEARHAVHDFERGIRGSVTVGLTAGFADTMAADAIETCSLLHPGITVNVVEDLSASLTKRISTEETLSFAIISGFDFAATTGLAFVRLFGEALYAVGTTNALGNIDQPMTFPDLARFGLILLGDGTSPNRGLKAELLNLARVAGVDLSITAEIQSLSVARQLAERGVGVAILPLDAVRTMVQERRLCARPLSSPAVEREIRLVWSSERPLSTAAESVKAVWMELLLARDRMREATALEI
jgi:LysR family nitrogen assimilation transcriptional regulator